MIERLLRSREQFALGKGGGVASLFVGRSQSGVDVDVDVERMILVVGRQPLEALAVHRAQPRARGGHGPLAQPARGKAKVVAVMVGACRGGAVPLKQASGGKGPLLAVGRNDGRVGVLNLSATHNEKARNTPTGSPVTALALSPDGGRVAFGDESGAAGVVGLPAMG